MAALALGCGPEAPSLSVDLRTDFVPGIEFDGVAVSVATETSTVAVLREQDFVRGVRVGRFEAEAGTQTVRLELLRAGEVLVERVATVTVAVDSVVQLVISRDCRDVRCAESLSCRDGACVDMRCTASTPEFCPDPECMVASECPAAVSCASSICASGVCLFRPDDSQCGAATCDLMLGCVGGMSDGGIADVAGDAAVDAGGDAAVDATSDAAGDAGMDVPDVFSSGARCPERFEPTIACDVLRQTGCAPGQSCLPSGEDAMCTDHGDKVEGDLCAQGECGLGLRCRRQIVSDLRRCSRICTAAHDCTCAESERCVPGEVPFGSCMVGASCDPVGQTGCGPGETCYLTTFGPTCTVDSGTLPLDTSCDATTECAPGHFCFSALGMGRRCLRACELSDVRCICTSGGFSSEYGYCQ